MNKSGDSSQYSILIVDDDPILRNHLSILLKDKGFNVDSAENGQEALSAIEKQFYSILITDWMMPKLNGIELCRKVRSMKLSGYVFIIILTGHGEDEDEIIQGLEAGADEYLIKPVSPAELMVRINSGLRVLKLEESLKKSNQEIQYLAITDPLTKCYNREYLNQALQSEIKKAMRYQYPLSLIMCDIDHFKNINDTHGHQCGDTVLTDFTKFLSSMIRDNVDWIARYGGEEFLIVLPHTDGKDAYTAAQRIQKELSQLSFKLNDDSEIKISSSFGISFYNVSKHYKDPDMDSMLKEADDLLYIAKHDGRNTIRIEL